MRNSRRIATLETEIADLKAAVERLKPRPVVVEHQTITREQAEAIGPLVAFNAEMRRRAAGAR